MNDKADRGSTIEEMQAVDYALQAQLFLKECAELMYQYHSYDDLVIKLLHPITQFFHAENTTIVRRLDDQRMLYQYEDHGTAAQQCVKLVEEVTDFSIWQQLLFQQDFLILEDNEQGRSIDPAAVALMRKQGIHTLVLGALSHQSKLYGYLGIANPTAVSIRMMKPVYQTLCMNLMISYKNDQDEAAMRKLSTFDSLTGLKNRDCYIKELQQYEQTCHDAGVVYLDMNGLKDINDRFGHIRGDAVLMECADLLKHIFLNYPDTHLYRMGGDEFIVLSFGITKAEFLENVLELKRTCELQTTFKAAIGYAWSDVIHHLSELVSEADFKMYEDKKSFYRSNLSSNRYRHYHDDVLELVEPKILRNRLDEHAFLIYLQPKFSFHDKTLIGAEALIRYTSFDGTILAPGQFLPLLEDANLITHIDFFVFDEICRKQKEWQLQGKVLVPISTNFSRYSIFERSFIEKLDAIVLKHGIDKQLMEIEITETVEGFDGMHLAERIDDIRQAGYAISIDDFGAHYANLSLFTSVEFNVLKIDKSLIDHIVSNKKAQSVISSIVDICRSMDVKIIVEGVETYLQFETLKRLGCEGIQGYLFSKPLPLEEYERLYMGT